MGIALDGPLDAREPLLRPAGEDMAWAQFGPDQIAFSASSRAFM
jgi:hypothetical protein